MPFIQLENEITATITFWTVDAFGAEQKEPTGSCQIEHDLSTNVWIMKETMAHPGWGQLLYDLAIEFASASTRGLIPDRLEVFKPAQDLWFRYFAQRADVTHAPYQGSRYQGDLKHPDALEFLEQIYSKPDVIFAELDRRGAVVREVA